VALIERADPALRISPRQAFGRSVTAAALR
jgi:hypothetical protein